MKRQVGIALACLVMCAAPGRAATAPAKPPTSADPAVAAVIDSGEVLVVRNRYPEAESLAVQLLPRTARAPGADSIDVARTVDLYSNARLRQNELVDGLAFDALEHAMRIYRRIGPTCDWLLARAESRAASYYVDAGQFERAVENGRAAVEVARRVVPPDSSLIGACELNHAVALVALDRWDEARVAYQAALELREGLFGRNDPRIVPTLAEYGVFLSRMGEFDAGRDLLTRAVAIADADSLKHSDLLPGSLSRLSTLEDRAGNVSVSLARAQRAYDLTRADRGEDAPPTIRMRVIVAYRLAELGDQASAIAALRGVLPAMEQKLGATNAQTITTRLSLAELLFKSGDSGAAREEVVRLRPLVFAPEHPSFNDRARLCILAADLDVAAGRVAAARESIDAMARMAPARQDSTGARLANLIAAHLRTDRGPADASDLDATRARADSLVAYPRLRILPEYEALRLETARAQWRVGRDADAWASALDAESLERERFGFQLESLPDERALQFADQLGEPVGVLVALAVDDPSRGAEAWDRLVRWRGRVGDEVARRRAPMLEASDSSLVRAHARWITAQRHLAQLVVAGVVSVRDSGTATRYAEVRREAERAEGAYVAAAGEDRVRQDSVSLARVRAVLGPDQVLVAFASASPRAGSGVGTRVAFVLRGPVGDVHVLRLGSVDALQRTVGPWLVTLTAPPSTRDAARAAEATARARGAAVRRLAWDPLVPYLHGARDVFLVPEGELFRVPWCALPAAGGRYLAEENMTIHVLNAERELLDRSPAPRAKGGLLAVGGPDFAQGARLPVALPPLPGARAEVEDIARAWPRAEGPATLLEGDAATEAAFKRLAGGHDVLHLATHGVAVDDVATPGGDGLRGVGGIVDPTRAPRPAALATESRASNVPRQVWLALAGANRPLAESADENEGLLTTEEVVTLDLRGTDWVVLSACQSGVGPTWSREGVLGMRRSFHLAGARTIIASQWPVADTATREWMRELYAARARHEDAALAVRAACRAVLAARRKDGRSTDPFYWAAFLPTGE